MSKADELMAEIDEARRLNQQVSKAFVRKLAGEIRSSLELSQQTLNELKTRHSSDFPKRGAVALSERGILVANGGDFSLQQRAMDRVMHPSSIYVPKSSFVNYDGRIPQDFSHAEPKMLSRDPESRVFAVSRPFCNAGGCEQYIETIVDNERKMFAFAMNEGRASTRGRMQPSVIHLFTPGELISENGSLLGGGGGSIRSVPINLSPSDLHRPAREIAKEVVNDNGVSPFARRRR